MSLVLAYASCAVAASLILLQWRAVRLTVANTRKLQVVFPPKPLRGVEEVQSEYPVALPLGSHLPMCSARRLTARSNESDIIDRSALIGKSTVILFCRAGELENWDAKVIMAVLRGCWTKVDGPVFVCLRSDDDLDLNCAAVCALRDSSISKDVVLAVDQGDSFWKGYGIRDTPCLVQLDRAGILKRYGIMTVPAAPVRDYGRTDV